MIFTVKQLMPYFKVYYSLGVVRKANSLGFHLINTIRRRRTPLRYEIPDDHPFMLSIKLMTKPHLKAVYTYDDLTHIWIRKNGKNYSKTQIKNILVYKLQIPVHCKGERFTAYFYLSDLKDFLTNLF